jgi:hypothetical protein
VPGPAALCADVYEIPFNTPELPDFRSFDSIGSIYAYSFAVPNQLSYTLSIPGVTSRDAWYGLDYHGTFTIRDAGIYEFQMMSDDGAVLQIDDTRVIDLDGLHQVKRGAGRIDLAAGVHTIHVPYFQGPPNAVALEVWIKAPGKDWNLFDVRDFAARPGDVGEKAAATPVVSAQ